MHQDLTPEQIEKVKALLKVQFLGCIDATLDNRVDELIQDFLTRNNIGPGDNMHFSFTYHTTYDTIMSYVGVIKESPESWPKKKIREIIAKLFLTKS